MSQAPIFNRQRNQIPSKATTKDLRDAIAALDLASMPAEQRIGALHAQLLRVAAETATNTGDRILLSALLEGRKPSIIIP